MGLIPEHLWIDSARVSQELETFIKTSVGDFNREGVIVGLSGGLDSSVVLALSVAAVGYNKVLGLVMPERDSSQDSESDARLLAETLGVKVERGCLIGWHFLYMPAGLNPDTSLMLTAKQRELMRVRGPRRIRNEKPLLTFDFWNDAPVAGGCISGSRHYFHINSHGDVEPCIFIHLATDNIHDKSLREVINSPFFKGFRARQPYGENLLRPCPIIDHPQVLREICAEFHPYSTDGPACGLITSPISDALDKYSQEVANIMDTVWERESAVRHFLPGKFVLGKVDEKKSVVKTPV